MWLTSRQKKMLFNATNENPSCINISVTYMGLALKESVRGHFHAKDICHSGDAIFRPGILGEADVLLAFTRFLQLCLESSSLSSGGRAWEGGLEVLPELWWVSWGRSPSCLPVLPREAGQA